LGNKPLPIRRTLAVLGLPALLADIHARVLVAFLQQERPALLGVGKRLLTRLADMRAGLDIPFVHQIFAAALLMPRRKLQGANRVGALPFTSLGCLSQS
jgi:hypothetical protein